MANTFATSITTPDRNASVPGLPVRGGPFGLIKRFALWALGASAAFVVVMGLLHTKLGAPVLAKLGVGCPVRAGTPEEVDRARMFGAALYAGKPDAPARPALGFVFEQTTIADVEAWAEKNGISCEKAGGTETIRSCGQVPAQAVGQPEWAGPIESVAFAFRANRTLSTVTTMRRKLPVARANAITAELAKGLNAALGAPAATGGENNPAHFAKGPMQAYQEEWTFGNYGATLSEVRLGDSGVLVREHYISPVP
jgi:hypothetical protein